MFEARRDLTGRATDEDAHRGNPWLAWARHSAHRLGEARGWPRKTRLNVDQALVIVLTGHAEGDVVRYSEVFPVLRSRGLSVERTTEVLDHIGVFRDDRPSSFELWLESKLDGLATGIAHDVGDWARLLHDGGPRSRARHAATVWNYLNRIRPVLLEWSNRLRPPARSHPRRRARPPRNRAGLAAADHDHRPAVAVRPVRPPAPPCCRLPIRHAP
ncbi:hypothetical protein ACWD48_20245 [Streptomyces sp. NPDC002519]